MHYPVPAAAVALLCLLSLCPAADYGLQSEVRRPATFRLSQLFTTALLCQPTGLSFKVLFAVLLSIAVFSSNPNTAATVALADVVMVAALGVAGLVWHASRHDRGRSFAQAVLFVASLLTLEAALSHARRSSEFECLEDRSGVGLGPGLAVSSAAQGTLLAIGGGAAVWSSGSRLFGLAVPRGLILTSVVVQGIAAAASSLCQGDLAGGMPSIFGFGACEWGAGCLESMRARRFAVLNSPIAALWFCCLATFVSSPGSGSELGVSEPSVFLFLGVPFVLLASLCTWSGSYAFTVELAALVAVVSLYLVACASSATLGAWAYLACLFLQQSVSIYDSGVVFFSYITNWSRVAEILLLAYRVAATNCKTARSLRHTVYVDVAGLSISSLLFVVSHGLTQAYTGRLVYTSPSDFTASVVDFARAQLGWVLCHFVSVFVWACLWHDSQSRLHSTPSLVKAMSCWVGVVVLVASCWTASTLLISSAVPYDSVDVPLASVLEVCSVAAWAASGLILLQGRF